MDYTTRRWRKKRVSILRRDKYQCQISKRYGKLVEADTVHHIYPAQEFPQYAFCSWNLISICKQEHNKLHIRNTQKLSKYGLELQRKTKIPPS